MTKQLVSDASDARLDGPWNTSGDARGEGRIFTGAWVAARGGVIEVTEPATGRLLTLVGRANPADVRAAAQVARAAQPAWAALPAAARARVVEDAARVMGAMGDAVVRWLMREGGSAGGKAQVEHEHALGFLRHAAAMALEPCGHILASAPPRTSVAERVPLGVVGVISPFNFPLVLSIRAVAPALAAGNAVVLKPDPRTPVSGGFLIAQAFAAAGLPPGLLHILPGGAEVGQAMCADPDIAMITFTGSTGAGRAVGELAGRHLKKVQLELGGKNALVILDDADIDLAARNAAWGAWLHQGQICMSTGRILVHHSLHDALVERLVAKARALPVGDPLDGVAVGPLIDPGQVARVHAIVEASVAAGAKLLAGGTHDGRCYAPTVLAGVTPSMPAFEEEIFGPVAVVTAYTDDDQAVDLANRGTYGLAAGVIGANVDRAARLGARLRTGHLHINDQTVVAEPQAPFGGMGASGNGSRISGPANWDEFTTWRWTTTQPQAPAYPF
ncbi:benzaldehyde dehydrogenase [Nitrospirillum amazonense]|uniref:Benzaldehyde dehydrogenase (NAD+) n=1 Tax=Nitrospirillum amazonense TaxID=28077 RepID=A0A560JQF8_9PROT|nr:benzaldehyde dehydrogenase [Nitrospirillum amazonense]MDG3442768.1 benzaldehyde dehydrogenase [Nitrospirillum amazonense]TWB71764.1 benzaldehyde dehydrogenase (NAD+) [Nitrospirillum amazonense]